MANAFDKFDSASTSNSNPFDQFDTPREIGMLEASGRVLKGALHKAAAAGAMIGGGLTSAGGLAPNAASDALFKAADEQAQAAKDTDLQANEHAGILAKGAQFATSIPAGIVEAPTLPFEMGQDVTQHGGSTVQALTAAGLSLPATAIAAVAPELGGRAAGALVGAGAKRLVAKAAGGAAASVVGGPASRAVQNLGLPDSMQQPVAPTWEDLASGAGFGLLSHTPVAAHERVGAAVQTAVKGLGESDALANHLSLAAADHAKAEGVAAHPAVHTDAAIDQSKDADLQALSPTYEKLRKQGFSEDAAKGAMKGALQGKLSDTGGGDNVDAALGGEGEAGWGADEVAASAPQPGPADQQIAALQQRAAAATSSTAKKLFEGQAKAAQEAHAILQDANLAGQQGDHATRARLMQERAKLYEKAGIADPLGLSTASAPPAGAAPAPEGGQLAPYDYTAPGQGFAVDEQGRARGAATPEAGAAPPTSVDSTAEQQQALAGPPQRLALPHIPDWQPEARAVTPEGDVYPPGTPPPPRPAGPGEAVAAMQHPAYSHAYPEEFHTAAEAEGLPVNEMTARVTDALTHLLEVDPKHADLLGSSNLNLREIYHAALKRISEIHRGEGAGDGEEVPQGDQAAAASVEVGDGEPEAAEATGVDQGEQDKAALAAARAKPKPKAEPGITVREGIPDSYDTTKSVGLGGGKSLDGKRGYISRMIPSHMDVPDREGNIVNFPVHEEMVKHEDAEHPNIAAKGYDKAHDEDGNGATAKMAAKYNIDPVVLSNMMRPHLRAAELDALQHPENVPTDLDHRPYIKGDGMSDTDNAHLLPESHPQLIRRLPGKSTVARRDATRTARIKELQEMNDGREQLHATGAAGAGDEGSGAVRAEEKAGRGNEEKAPAAGNGRNLDEAGVKENATGKERKQASNAAKLRGVRKGSNVPAHPEEVRQEEGGRAAGGGGDEGSGKEQPAARDSNETVAPSWAKPGTKVSRTGKYSGRSSDAGKIESISPSGKLIKVRTPDGTRVIDYRWKPSKERFESAFGDDLTPTKIEPKAEPIAEVQRLTSEEIHKDPGEAAETVTPGIVTKALGKSPKDIKAARDDLAAQVRAKATQALSDKDALAKFGYERNKHGTIIGPDHRGPYLPKLKINTGDVNKDIGYVEFHVPGDGKFKILNTKEALERFAKNVERNQGFSGKKFTHEPPRPNTTLTKEEQADLDAQRAENAKREAAGDDGIDFQRSEDARHGMRAAGVQRIADLVTKDWKNAPRIHVHNSLDANTVHPDVRAEHARQVAGGATGVPRAWVHEGDIHLNAAAMRDTKSIVNAIFHEALGHAGLRGAFGDALKDVLSDVQRLRPDDIEAKMKEYGFADTPRNRLRAAEEVLARMAQDNPHIGVVRQALAAIRKWLRENVPGLKELKFTDDELIKHFIDPARKWVREGAGGEEPPPRGGRTAPAFMKDVDHSTKYYFAKTAANAGLLDKFQSAKLERLERDRFKPGSITKTQDEFEKGISEIYDKLPPEIAKLRDDTLAESPESSPAFLRDQDEPSVLDAKMKVASGVVGKAFDSVMGKNPDVARQLGRQGLRAALAKSIRADTKARFMLKDVRDYADRLLRKDPAAVRKASEDWEAGRPVSDPRLRSFFQTAKKYGDQMVDQVRATGKEMGYIENYLPHLYKDPKVAEQVLHNYMQTRPLRTGGFTKERFHETLEHARKSGLKPVSENPVDLFLAHWSQMHKYVEMSKFKDHLDGHGLLNDDPGRFRAPEGWDRINDPLFQGKIAPAGVAKDVNNHLAQGLYKLPAWQGFRAAQNALLGLRLTASLYHAGMTTVDSILSHSSIGFQRALMGDAKGAAESMVNAAKALPQAAADLLGKGKGSQMVAEFLGMKPTDPTTALIYDHLTRGGSRVFMEKTDTNDAITKFQRSMMQGKYGSAALNAFGAGIEGMTYHIAHKLVPAQKMIARTALFKLRLDQYAKRVGAQPGDYAAIINKMHPDFVDQLASKVSDDVDDRLGQFAYDNLFMNRMVRDAMAATVQSPGWNIGSSRLIFGGLSDIRKLIHPDAPTLPLDKEGKIKDLTGPRLTSRLAYLLTMNAGVMAFNGMMTALNTGESPTGKDWFYFRTGAKNRDGSDERMNLPSYMRDEYGAMTHPVQMVETKLHPSISTAIELWKNHDYYGDMIHNAADPWPEQAKQYLAYFTKGITPYAVQNVERNDQAGGGALRDVLPFFGVTPAPSSVTRSGFQQQVMEATERQPHISGRSPEQVQHAHMLSDAINAVRSGDRTVLNTMSRKDRETVLKDSKQDIITYRFKQLPLTEQLDAYDKASDDEKDKYKLRQILSAHLMSQRGRSELEALAATDPDAVQAIRDKIRSIRHPEMAESQ